MKESEQPKHNILRKLNGLGPITNREWDCMVKQSKTLRHIGANVVGADIVEENILDLLCRLQSSQDKVTEEQQRVDAWIDKYNDINGEKRNWKEKYNRLYSKAEHTIRKLVNIIDSLEDMKDKLIVSNIQRCIDDLQKALSGKETLSDEEVDAIIQEQKDGQAEDIRKGN